MVKGKQAQIMCRAQERLFDVIARSMKAELIAELQTHEDKTVICRSRLQLFSRCTSFLSTA